MVLQAVSRRTTKMGRHVRHDLDDGWLTLSDAAGGSSAPDAHCLSAFQWLRWLTLSCIVMREQIADVYGSFLLMTSPVLRDFRLQVSPRVGAVASHACADAVLL